MSTATPAEAVEQTFKPIQQFTRGWMMAESTERYGVEVVGMRPGRDFWIVGRAGVLGSCTPEVAAGALAWGREALTPVFDHDDLARIDVLGRRIADAAPLSLGAVFAGWRALPEPADVGQRVALTTQVLREMRGAAHINAITACGLTPLDAILASTNAPPRTGPGYAERMGFTGPFRDPEEVRADRLEAEATTARIMEGFYATLSPEELAQFGHLVETTRSAIDM